MQPPLETRYLDLLKKTLSFSLWPEPAVPIDTFNLGSTLFRRPIVAAVSRVLARWNLKVVKTVQVSAEDKRVGKFHPMLAHTMIGQPRLENVQACVETALKEGIQGDLIEAGVWRGGSAILMRAVLEAHDDRIRRVFVADSFEGLPKPDPEKFPHDAGDKHYKNRYLAVSEEEVRENFRSFDLMDDRVIFLKGWFKDTLHVVPSEAFAVIRIDGDMYQSTIEALSALYPKLSDGGFCIVDDYALKGCREAVDDFRRDHQIPVPLTHVDWTGVFWRK